MRVLVTGATGYIGGRLIPRLLERGHQVRVLVRDATRVQGRDWSDQVQVCQGDVLAVDSLRPALDGVQAAYYLVHSMGGQGDFAARDRQAAQNFVQAGRAVSRVIYLGGLLPPGEASKHLASRGEVGAILREGLAATELRAGPIVGSGSASFEMVRYIAERFPLLLAPRGVSNSIQPIGVEDMLAYLQAALDGRATGVVDVGSDRISFADMVTIYAQLRGLRRPLREVPLVRPALAALLVGWLTPIPRDLAAPLLEGLNHPVVADLERARSLFPEVRPHSYREAASRALSERDVPTSWRTSLGGEYRVERVDWEGLYRERHILRVRAPASAVFRAFCRLGGDRGWVAWNRAWWLRGLIDQWLGGPGLRRGRRHPEEIYPGEALDLWRVEAV
ncbi:MAG: DUF2867 domain-containing protein, partial [Candidatus Eremiobacterota bacterium]